jgi:hypothetical protein
MYLIYKHFLCRYYGTKVGLHGIWIPEEFEEVLGMFALRFHLVEMHGVLTQLAYMQAQSIHEKCM